MSILSAITEQVLLLFHLDSIYISLFVKMVGGRDENSVNINYIYKN